jgi:archaellin
MNDQAQLGIITLILLLGFILIGAVSASVLLTDNNTITEKDANKITTEVLDEICSYLQIKDIIGKYQIIQGEQKIQKIAILIKPLVTQDIDISHMTIQLTNGEQLQISIS